MKVTPILLLAALAFFSTASASTSEPLDLAVRFGYYHASFIINENGTAVGSYAWSKKVLKEAALDSAKKASIGYSTSAQKAEVVSAYTQKTDGRRIDVPKDNYQIEVNSGKGKDSPVYSDWTTLTVVFPDVAVGDTVVFSYRLTEIEPMFPGHFSMSQYFYNQVAYDDVRVSFDYPSSMWVQHKARRMKEIQNEIHGSRKIIEWAYENPVPLKSERRDFSVFDPEQEAGYAFSTFKSYSDISYAYGERAQPKAAVTPRIRKLAAEIVKGRTQPKDQARSLYEWVAKNITYAGNCIGIGAVVPRDLDYILDNKMGDCKDHAILLQSLLTARGINSIQALVNSGSIYRLPQIPVVANVNHVFNYLPDFDLYVDSTSDSTPFGMLPYGDQDKPVLLVEGYRDGMKTPVQPVGSNSQRVKSNIQITHNGSVTGNMEVFQKGQIAIQSRIWARELTTNAEQDMVKNLFQRQGMIGSGTFVKDDPTELTDNYHFKASIDAEKFIRLPGAGAFYIHPPLGIIMPIYSVMQAALAPTPEENVVCGSIHLTEEYIIELPPKVKVLSFPDSVKFANDLVSYTASYKLKGNILTVKRILDDRTKGNVCTPKIFAEYKKIAEQAMDNLKEQVLYK